ncbi:MAG: type II toxin-antitoxin system prevent-host-death family antitoxin [Candidatus Eremiobacter antarcticus]|nr:type II toxin-antitoxin system Phd/YefM family antitoxin [Candidatus Eremiobacteraeota bacterium]PZR62334.1 MAG: type II toxin-antitoxin system prevent-host-death family antitoxin [Candidatus Eremiobacter sp. RRmetagenome_bin22]
MKTVDAFEAKTNFSSLLGEAERGETIVVTKKGRPVAQLGPIETKNAEISPAEAMKTLLSMKNRLHGDSNTKIG